MDIGKINGAREIAFVGRHKPCVYFLVGDGGEVLYIGKSQSVGVRIGQHMASKRFERLFIIECKNDEEAFKKESRLILKYQPPMNHRVDAWRLGLLTREKILRVLKERGCRKTWREVDALLWVYKKNPIEFHSVKYYKPDVVDFIIEKVL